MSVIRVTKIFQFSMAHALQNYSGLCKNIHGHTYHLEVTVRGETAQSPVSPKDGMLIDFSDLKKLVNTHVVDIWDHALMLNANSPAALLEEVQKHYEKVIIVPFQPTTENMLAFLAQKIQEVLPENVYLYALKLSETPNSYAEWVATDNC